MNILKLIKKFPKKRKALPKPLRKIFNSFYLKNRQNFLSQMSERWLHVSMDDRNKNKRTLELGAGTLNHLRFEFNDKQYDIIEPRKFLFKKF